MKIQNFDQNIENKKRRFQGAFFTPLNWVEEAHKMISDEFGEEWKSDYVVWDNSCGTLNLTRDFKFKELYSSTLSQDELDISKDLNPEGVKFQFNFLNDSETKMPDGLKLALKTGKKIIFFMNPPYGAAGNTRGKTGKKKIGQSIISQIMKNEGLKGCSEQLYAQFLYRIMNIQKKYKDCDINICVFSKLLFFTGISYKDFRVDFFKNFRYKTGMLFNAGHFNDVSGIWPISFSIFKNGIDKNKNKFVFILKDIKDEKIVNIGEKIIYNINNEYLASSWIKEEIKNAKFYNTPKLSSGLKIKLNGGNVKTVKNNLGYFQSQDNAVQRNLQSVLLFSSTYSYGDGVSITKDNFRKVVALYTARKTIKGTWINDRDGYLPPNMDHPGYEEWNNDCLVYSLFHSSSNQTSMRDIFYKNKKWDIENQFFFMSRRDMWKLAKEYRFKELYQDIKGTKERHMYLELEKVTLSPDAQEVLNDGRNLIKKTFKIRESIHQQNPDFHLNTWDAGWYQIKKILNIAFKDDLKAFNIKYRKFEDRMREGVYKFEFLRR